MKNGKLSAVVAIAMAVNLSLAGLATASDSGTGSATVQGGSETFELDASSYQYQTTEGGAVCGGSDVTLDGTDQSVCFRMNVEWEDFEGESGIEDINVTMSELEDGSSNIWNYSQSGSDGVENNSSLGVPDDGGADGFIWNNVGSIQSNADLLALGGSAGVAGSDMAVGAFTADVERANIVVFNRNNQVATFDVSIVFIFDLDAPSSVLPGTYSHVITVSKTEN